ncbi:sec1/munc18-like (SM) proteins superfamily [Artemisia annua]|uniref:Sec1/munc18-like (SM) proteins superfamily n=1 Tax=Artemisia annua TaxID=35608 RepID=A0A2U1L760_ARTAN|nr:sec1/munc18-like (SM) proteins superfamily [Artemisia annua]
MALEEFYGNEVMTQKGYECLNLMANRIATVFASLLEFPSVRYRAAKSLDLNTMTTISDIIPTKLAATVWDCLMKYKSLKNFNFPQTETCELLILDRSIDQIAPIIHEWTYDAMCHDLLNMDGSKYVQEVASKTGGVPEKKEVLLEEHDPVWLELCHAHIADASERLHDKMSSFVSTNKAAQMRSRGGGELSDRDIQKIAQALQQYSEQIDKLSLHIDIAAKINKIIRELGLKQVGQLEQDLVFGDAGTKEVINFLKTKPDAPCEIKLRLLMIYVATHPEKFRSDKLAKLMELARLSSDDMKAVYNMKFLEGSSEAKKKSSCVFSLKMDARKELIEKLSNNELPKNDYPCINDSSPTFHERAKSKSAEMVEPPPAHSVRSRRTPTWARPRDSEDGNSSDHSILRHASSDIKKIGRRIFVFIIGGATRSEYLYVNTENLTLHSLQLRVCHKLTTKLKREVVLCSSSLDDPQQFITKLKLMTANDISLDNLGI